MENKKMINSEEIVPGSVFVFTVQEDGQRLDSFVSDQFPTYSRSFFKTLIENGCILINEKAPTKAGASLKVDDKVTVTFPQKRIPKEYNLEELDALKIEIIFKHDDFLVLYKPAGVLVHPPSEKSDVLCLTDWLTGSFKNIKYVGYNNRPGIVHRLDQDTSGLLLVALNNEAHTTLSDLFKNRTISKTYLAVVKGQTEKEGTIDFPIGRHHTIRNRMANVARGRASTTHYKVLEYFEEATLVQVTPVTGRTHQIRVHFATEGHPLLGDKLYGKVSKHIKRQALHAQKLSFNYKGKDYEFEKEPPQDFATLLTRLQKIEK